MSTHYVMYQVMYPRVMTSVSHYIVFTQTEGKIFFNPSSDKCCGCLLIVHKIKQVLYGYYLNNGDHRANTFVMRSIWVNTVNTVNADVIMNEEVLVFHFKIRKLYTVTFCIVTYRTRGFIQKFMLHPIFPLVSFRSVQFRWFTPCKVVLPGLDKSRMPRQHGA